MTACRTELVRRLNASCPAISDGHLVAFNDHRHFALTLGRFQHGIHVLPGCFHIHVVMCLMGRPGPFGVRSAGLSIDDHLLTHGFSPFSAVRSFYFRSSIFSYCRQAF